MHTFFASVKKRNDSSPPSRPTPLCFIGSATMILTRAAGFSPRELTKGSRIPKVNPDVVESLSFGVADGYVEIEHNCSFEMLPCRANAVFGSITVFRGVRASTFSQGQCPLLVPEEA